LKDNENPKNALKKYAIFSPFKESSPDYSAYIEENDIFNSTKKNLQVYIY
jgi:hypothetical protein